MDSSKKAEESKSLEVSEQSASGLKKIKNDEVSNKVDPRIATLMSQASSSKQIESNTLAKTKKSQVQVYVVVKRASESDIALLKKHGLEIEIVNTKLKKIQAWVSLNNIVEIAELDNVIGITTPSYGSPRIR